MMCTPVTSAGRWPVFPLHSALPQTPSAGTPTFTVKDIYRHTYATWLVSDGVPINDVASVLGHEQTSTTLDRYTHASRDRHSRVRGVLADFSLTSAPDQAPSNDGDPSEEGS
jgi:hypothetical protein